MRRRRHMIGSGRLWRGLLCVCAVSLLSGCDWLFGSGIPIASQKLRPGAERQVTPSAALPAPAAGQGYDAGFTPVDETRQTAIGTIIQGKGGQKAQKEAADKEAAERDAKAREERQAREAAEKEAKAKEEPEATPASTSAAPQVGMPGKPAAAVRGNSGAADEPPAPGSLGAPPTPAAPVAPPAAPGAPVATPSAPDSPAAPGPAPPPGPDRSTAPPRT